MVKEQDDMNTKPKAYLVGSGIGSLAAAAFMIRDGKLPGGNISILEAAPIMGGSLDGAGDPADGYSLRGGRMLTTDNYECTWDLYKSIPSLNHNGKTVFEETVEFNHAIARQPQGTGAIVLGYPDPGMKVKARVGPVEHPLGLVFVEPAAAHEEPEHRAAEHLGQREGVVAGPPRPAHEGPVGPKAAIGDDEASVCYVATWELVYYKLAPNVRLWDSASHIRPLRTLSLLASRF